MSVFHGFFPNENLMENLRKLRGCPDNNDDHSNNMPMSSLSFFDVFDLISPISGTL